VATNQRDGQMAYHVDGVEAGENPHVNYEPSSRGGLREAERAGLDHTPYVEGAVVRQRISRTNDFKQAGERYRTMEDWERADLVNNLSNALAQCNADIQERMITLLTNCDADYGRRVAEGINARTAAQSPSAASVAN
jgi:catalase